jgi:alkylation response protein AidB-like acyl-CoA dehydrogenase
VDLDFNEEQVLLRDTLRALCAEHVDGARLRAWESASCGFAGDLWCALAGLGVTGLRVPEAYGGSGLGLLETTIVHEELGRVLAPTPHAVGCVQAVRLIARMGAGAQQSAWLSGIASGREILIPAWRESGRSADLSALTLRGTKDGGRIRLNGEKTLVPFAASATGFLVLAQLGSEHLLVHVPANAEGLALRTQPNHAGQALGHLQFDGVEVPEDALLACEALAGAWRDATAETLVALAAESIGGAARLLEITLAHVRSREQFGQPLGAFQSVAHALADAATELEGARYLVYQAAWAADAGKPFQRLALMAKLQAGSVFRRVSWKAVQFHGGIGFSLDADPQLYYRRAKHQQLMGWEPAWLEEQIAREVFG